MATKKDDVLKYPINYLYIFTNDSFIKLVAKYINKKAAQVIAQKAANQRKYLSTVIYDGTADFNSNAYNDFTNAIQEQYGMTPQTILKKLLSGEEVAGKNWKEGVYGIGKTNNTLAFSGNASIMVDSATGKVYETASGDDIEISGGTPIYKRKGKKTIVSGYSYNIDGKTYTTNVNRDGTFYADSQGDANGTYDAFGNDKGAADFASVWNCVKTCVPMFQKFINWLLSLFGKTPITQANTQPSQSEFVTEDSGSNTSVASIGIIGTLLIGGALIMGMPKTKKRK